MPHNKLVYNQERKKKKELKAGCSDVKFPSVPNILCLMFLKNVKKAIR